MVRPYSRVIEAVAAIAAKLGGTVINHGDRLADNLEAIAGANINSLPEIPEEDGAYVLTATIADGEVTYSWESTGT